MPVAQEKSRTFDRQVAFAVEPEAKRETSAISNLVVKGRRTPEKHGRGVKAQDTGRSPRRARWARGYKRRHRSILRPPDQILGIEPDSARLAHATAVIAQDGPAKPPYRHPAAEPIQGREPSVTTLALPFGAARSIFDNRSPGRRYEVIERFHWLWSDR